MWQSQPSRTEDRVKVVRFDGDLRNMVNISSLPQKSSTKIYTKYLAIVTTSENGFIVSIFHTSQTSFMLYYYWIIAYLGCLLCPWWPGMALCETPSWECPWINLGLAQDCLGLLGDGGGLAVTACFRGVRAIGWPNCPWLRLREQEADRTTPTVEPPATWTILGSWIRKHIPTHPDRHTQTGWQRKTCGGKLHDRKPPACDNDDAMAGHCPKSLKSL